MVSILAVAALLGLLFSAFFSAAELSIFSLGDARVRTLLSEGFRGAPAVDELRSRPERLLVLLRLGDAAANALAAGASAYLGWLLGGAGGAALGVVLATVVIVIAGELIPLRVAVTSGVRMALWSATLLEPVVRGLGPALGMIAGATQLRPRGSVEQIVSTAERQVRELAALGHTEGVIDEHERQLVERVFRLDETRVWDIMTPRVDVFAWEESRTLAEIASELRTVPYSRVPIYRESVDDISGLLYLRDAYQALVAGQRDIALRALAREPLIVPGSLSLTTLLRDFQTRRIHLAVVVDEYGGTDGLVTLEDVLEELVGEIVDETDVAYEPMIRVSRHEVIAAGDADLREINHFFNTPFPHLEHRSLNGYLLEELGRVPDAGETMEREGIEIQVLEASGTQVLRARLRRKHDAPKLLAPDASERPRPRRAEPSAAEEDQPAAAEDRRSAG